MDGLAKARALAATAVKSYLCNETFYRFEPSGIASCYYSSGGAKAWTNARWFFVDERGVYAIDSVYESGGYRSTRCSFDADGRVAGYEERGEKDAKETFDARDFEYDAFGELVRVYWRYVDGRRTVYWERAPKKETLAAMREVLLAGLLEAATRAIAALPISEPVFAIAVHYTDADYKKRLPPEIAIGLETTDRATMTEAPYDPTDWEHFSVNLGLDDAFSALCTEVNADIHQNNRQKGADALFADLARALGEHKWLFDNTKDFVSYALNHDKGPAEKQVAKFTRKR